MNANIYDNAIKTHVATPIVFKDTHFIPLAAFSQALLTLNSIFSPNGIIENIPINTAKAIIA